MLWKSHGTQEGFTLTIRSKKIRDSACGEECTLRLTGTCNGNSETVVLCHVGKIRGMAIKCNDSFAIYACAACHDALDGRVKYSHELNPNISEDVLRALELTQNRLIEKGLMVIK